ncbi:hypothetical protein MIND_00159200 [Mycena indigotica]|uniref:HNH nuclease domain-containing protein n=1 Tax=Mycena indigotica TaxID=2126181 RepID=A0A8H6WL36_9AGAR|nr:uncharacterized protein MIND_00159200 [Mycena indigotica]KAF7316404.1 hypothetical protein MIND_00159200 [Mycena indigotica]
MSLPLTKPVLPNFKWPENAVVESSYISVLEAESSAVNSYNMSKNEASRQLNAANIVNARVVGFLYQQFFELRETALGNKPLTQVHKEVVSSPDETAIYAHGQRYVDHLICPFRTKSKEGIASSHSSRASSDHAGDAHDVELQTGARSSPRTRALARDYYRCAVTGIYDNKSLKTREKLSMQLKSSEENYYRNLVETCHILNNSLFENVEPSSIRENNEATALRILRDFGMETLVDSLLRTANKAASETRSSNLCNIISLTSNVHHLFGELQMTFQPVKGEEDTYLVKFMGDGRQRTAEMINEKIIFRNWAPIHRIAEARTDLPLPDARLLILHCACAHVAYLSGAGELLDDILNHDDYKDIGVLAEDGGSMDVLRAALTPLAAIRA